jgi:hypothetical protein
MANNERGNMKKLARELIRQMSSMSGGTTLNNGRKSPTARLSAPVFDQYEPGLNHLERTLANLGRSGSLYMNRLSSRRGAKTVATE